MIFLIIFGLLAAAVLYGLFFLVFKLIWVLCKKPRNFWPLILAGATTVLTITFAVWSVYSAANRYILPLMPIAEAVQTRRQPVYGVQTYTDARFGFAVNLYDGTVMSDWIDLPDGGPSLLLGVDTNTFITDTQSQEDKPFSAYLLARVPNVEMNAGALETAQKLAQRAEEMEFNGRIVVNEIAPSYAGPGTTAAIISGTLFSAEDSHLSFLMLIAKENDLLYALLAVYSDTATQAEQTLRSFRMHAQNRQPLPPSALPASVQP